MDSNLKTISSMSKVSIVNDFLLLRALIEAANVKNIKFILIISTGMALLETLGIASILPFLTVLTDDSAIENSVALSAIFALVKNFGVDTKEFFVVILGVASILILILSAAYKVCTIFLLNRFIESVRSGLSNQLFKNYARVNRLYLC